MAIEQIVVLGLFVLVVSCVVLTSVLVAALVGLVQDAYCAVEEMALRKPYSLIEVDERGVRQISELNSRAQAREAKPGELSTPPSIPPSDDLPPLDDEIEVIGER